MWGGGGEGGRICDKCGGEPASLRLVSEIVGGAFQGRALAVVQFGILLLIAIPVCRVLFVGIGYLIERDWLYVLVAAIVLVVLGSSLMGLKLQPGLRQVNCIVAATVFLARTGRFR